MFNTGLALELERNRNKKPVMASLVATTQPPAVPTDDKPTRIDRLRKAQVQSLKDKAKQKLSILNKVEFGTGTKMLFWLIIILNIIGDILDLAILFGGAPEAISLAYDTVLLPVNIVFLGMNPKNNVAAGKKQLNRVLIRFLGVENIPVVSIFYLRTIYVVRLYRARLRAAKEGVAQEATI